MASDQKTIVYSKNNCQPCNATKRKLTLEGVPYVEVNVDENPQAAADLRAQGWKESPVVVPTGAGDAWSGYQPDRIVELGRAA